MTFYIQSVQNGLYLDIRGEAADTGAEVIVYTFHGGKNQQWRYKNGMIVSKLNEFVLDVDDKPDSGRIIMSSPKESESQKWHFDDDFTIRNELGMVLDVARGQKEAGTPVIAFKKHAGPNQKFRIVPINKKK